MFDRRRQVYRRRPYLSAGVASARYLGKAAYRYRVPLIAGAAGGMASSLYSSPRDIGPRDLSGYPLRQSEMKGRKGKASQRAVTSEISQIKGKLRKLKKLDDATTGTLTYRVGLAYALSSARNKQFAAAYAANDTTQIEQALANTKYFNPATPGTLTTASSVAGTYQRNMLIDYSSLTLNIRNNYQVPCEIDVYLCTVKDDTNQGPVSAWNAAVPDGSNLTDSTDLNQYPTDYNTYNDLWKTKKLMSKLLQSGQQITVSHSTSDFEYDSATVDTHGLVYQKEYKCFAIMVVLKGVLAHDTVLDEQCINPAGLDIEQKRVMKVKYSAGINISYSQVVNTYDTITNTSVVANKPVSDNQSYSVS